MSFRIQFHHSGTTSRHFPDIVPNREFVLWLGTSCAQLLCLNRIRNYLTDSGTHPGSGTQPVSGILPELLFFERQFSKILLLGTLLQQHLPESMCNIIPAFGMAHGMHDKVTVPPQDFLALFAIVFIFRRRALYQFLYKKNLGPFPLDPLRAVPLDPIR